ncbi:MAG: hypothetical protein IPM25_05370 [Chloracidobacterium sp.]|nr:hypothetical protein [Chloracidobacterium sp.]
MRGVLTFLILISIAAIPAAAQSDPKPELIDEFPASLCSEDLRARIDNFFATISQRPSSVGSVIVTPDSSIPGRAQKYRRIIENHVTHRQFDPKRVFFSNRPFGESRIQLWIIPKGAETSKQEPEPLRISEATLFDASGIAYSKWSREVIFGELHEEPCDFGLNFEQFANVLKADSGLTAHLLFTSGGGLSRKRTNAALKIAVKNLTDLGISPRRIISKYVGARKHAEMQLWLVPEGGARPTFRQGAVPN